MSAVPPLASESLGVYVAQIIIFISPNNNPPDYARKSFCMTENVNMPTTTLTPKSSSSTQLTWSPRKTPVSVLNKLKMSPGGFYAATPRLAYHTEYFLGGRDGNILITKGLNHDEEFIIHGVFQISRDDFCFTPDGNFNPTNVFHGHLEDLKLSCQLTAGRSKAFKFSSDNFSAVISNLSAFEKLAPREILYETLSVIRDTIGRRSIKLTHHLFEATDRDQDDDTSDDSSNSSTNATPMDGLGSEYDITTWPVANCYALK
ncbi:uncharacterized protein F5147DRAFT_776292 [Suillus discolor]|uniref:Uncharacterized protein n=1 Tax=Suillus discolor TaxID=1912936 RepID=A0A9P7F374_9AGAM|nr:uncharacterized protein F5147DRAFT_776292 [Suillus discolor]KAG2102546.1 hypothetical protein F5147DRAFT_776292 [Suillus discolor]